MPIIIGACAMPLVQFADVAIITNTLNGMKSIFVFGKEVIISKEVVDSLYGLTGYVNPIINMPAILSTALGMSLVPSISASNAMNDKLGVSTKSSTALKLSMLVGLPCTFGLYFLSTPIMHLLFERLQDVSSDANIAQLHLLSTGGDLLATMAAAVFFLTLLQTMSGILQGLGKTYIPVINLLIGVAVKIVLSIVLIRIPSINIQGAFLGTLVCYAIAAMLDVIFVLKYTKAPLHIVNNFIRPLFAAGVMGLFVYFMDQSPFMTELTPQGTILFSKPVTIIAIIGAMVIYFIAVLIFGAVNSDDMKYIPGGKKISKLMIKLHLWKAQV
jgi:stage V sporulation protein B